MLNNYFDTESTNSFRNMAVLSRSSCTQCSLLCWRTDHFKITDQHKFIVVLLGTSGPKPVSTDCLVSLAFLDFWVSGIGGERKESLLHIWLGVETHGATSDTPSSRAHQKKKKSEINKFGSALKDLLQVDRKWQPKSLIPCPFNPRW